MKLNREKVQQLLRERGWSEYRFSIKLDLDYTYVYRVMRDQRGIGRRFLERLLIFCESEGLNFREYIELE